MAENKHSTDAIAEDVIRSFTQLSANELHLKTLIEKRESELQNDLIDFEKVNYQEFIENLGHLSEELEDVTELRREMMLFVYELYDSIGDKERWCNVKHYAGASITAFEAWQAMPKNDKLYDFWQRSNRLFIGSLSRFLGLEMTECASCFADMIKGGSI